MVGNGAIPARQAFIYGPTGRARPIVICNDMMGWSDALHSNIVYAIGFARVGVYTRWLNIKGGSTSDFWIVFGGQTYYRYPARFGWGFVFTRKTVGLVKRQQQHWSIREWVGVGVGVRLAQGKGCPLCVSVLVAFAAHCILQHSKEEEEEQDEETMSKVNIAAALGC